MSKMVWRTVDDFLMDIKSSKKNELSSSCKEKIEEGFDQDISGTLYRFTYGIEKQQNFSDTMRLFDNNMIDKIGWNAYIGEEKVRIHLNKKEFTEVYLAGVQHKTNAITRLNDVLYPLVDAAENKETVARIYWDEGLPAEEISLKVGATIEDQVGDLKKRDDELEQSNMTLMMALVQVSGRIP